MLNLDEVFTKGVGHLPFVSNVVLRSSGGTWGLDTFGRGDGADSLRGPFQRQGGQEVPPPTKPRTLFLVGSLKILHMVSGFIISTGFWAY